MFRCLTEYPKNITIIQTAFKGVFRRFKPLELKGGINIPPSMRKAVKTHENALKWGIVNIH